MIIGPGNASPVGDHVYHLGFVVEDTIVGTHVYGSDGYTANLKCCIDPALSVKQEGKDDVRITYQTNNYWIKGKSYSLDDVITHCLS